VRISVAARGIAELVTDEEDGLLVEPENVAALARALDRISMECGLLERLRRGVRPPRTMDLVAEEVVELYGRCLNDRRFCSDGREAAA
jgi:hypothetical protein